MKCAKCGAELKQGCLYCSVCGHEAQLLPDYSVLEDDYLRALLKEDEVGGAPQTEEKTAAKKPKNKKSHKVLIIVICCIIVAAAATGVAVKMYIDNKNANSYDFQIEMAEKELVDRNYEKALGYYKTALALCPEDILVRMDMAGIYMQQKQYDSAMVLYIEIIQLDKDNVEAYKNLITIYDEKQDYDSIAALEDGVTNADILVLFSDYMVADPVISPVEGEYEEAATVTLFSMDDDTIYYTLDGSDPDAENGILYRDDGIELKEAGDYEVRAICCNDKEIYSDIVSAEYKITIKAPADPVVTPDGGRIETETLVTITAEADCSIYYTWDGSDPSPLSARYTEPLEIPSGNNILAVFVVNDRNGLSSSIYRTNFIYYP